MKKILNFLEQIKIEKESGLKLCIEEFAREHTEGDWNGNSLEIVEKNDIFLYLSEDKKAIKVTIGEYDPRIAFSFLICFCHVDYVAKYTNGGLHFIGFYDSDFSEVSEIAFNTFKITDSDVGWSFEGKQNPYFSFKLIHEDGYEINSFRANPYYSKTCQALIDGIWKLEQFYENWQKQLSDFRHDWYEIVGRSPKSLM